MAESEHSAEYRFFLIEIEFIEVRRFSSAPKFNIVERLNEWVRTMKAVEGLSDTAKLKMEYWQAFIDYAILKPEFKAQFNSRKAHPHYWYSRGQLFNGDCPYRKYTEESSGSRDLFQ